jgi:hypothetical protein
MYTFGLEEAVNLKVRKILGTLSNGAAAGSSMLRSNRIKMWMGAFAPRGPYNGHGKRHIVSIFHASHAWR